jgi:hypothetical protein
MRGRSGLQARLSVSGLGGVAVQGHCAGVDRGRRVGIGVQVL